MFENFSPRPFRGNAPSDLFELVRLSVFSVGDVKRRGSSLAFLSGRLFMQVLALGVLSACTTIQIEGGEVVKSGFAFAPISVKPTEGHPVTVVRSRGFGWVPHGDGFTLGYHKELRVMVSKPDACQLFILEPDFVTRDYERLIEVLKATGASLCSISKGG